MPCCKAEWCADLPTVYKDTEGKEYCVFHALQGEKGISVEEFNKLVFERIDKAIREEETCDLSGTIFDADIRFDQYKQYNPLPEIDFLGATFHGGVDFSMATFSKKANFWGAEFHKTAVFVGTTFRERAHFISTKFKDGATFWWVRFWGETIFYGIEVFEGKNSDVCFENINIKEKALFMNVNLEKFSFIDTDLRRIDFVNCTWHEKYGRYLLYDELRLFEEITDDGKKTGNFLHRLKQKLRREWSGFKKDISCDKKEIKKVEILYRKLKQKYKEERDELMVSIWHYGEKEMFRKGSCLRRFNPISLSNLYWLSSGYAEKHWRAGVILLLLIVSISILLALSGLVPLKGDSVYGIKEIKGLADIMDFGKFKVLILNTLQYATFQKEPYLEPVTVLGGYLKLLARILIPLQTALFALAVRNKFRR